MEVWKTLKMNGFEQYEISNKGNVRRNCKLLKIRKDRYGYCRINICQNNIRKTVHIHKLVALTYIDNPRQCKTVNHKDGNKSNNCVENLEWMTSLENSKHAYENDLYSSYIPVEIYSEQNNKFIGRFHSIRELCKKLKLINRKEVTIAINNNFSYRGYKFKKVR